MNGLSLAMVAVGILCWAGVAQPAAQFTVSVSGRSPLGTSSSESQGKSIQRLGVFLPGEFLDSAGDGPPRVTSSDGEVVSACGAAFPSAGWLVVHAGVSSTAWSLWCSPGVP